ncbi:MAG TPA: branched-chain amino acid transport [Acinetobacter sp.]|jgi:branched-subunit amino acid transport protein|uniref:Branched-chain amino acid transport protein (AzlD) n=1 Tax=Acinetobacter venetianus TaxID=52133 RepID=A0A150HWY8_9GAMM|nr:MULTISPECIES: AzlD domain-containing protein [Acinetobacter]MDA0697223.1 AzlD domain-containing protein [Pseudomonadota bacterium]KXZ71402.1 Branched-chain amino acid transport protein (AzlD) [Acinetobacter venetianus]MBC69902.1 branched-chain amino acid transport [Acinetobacter sp.]MBT49808.1 branched-chain amino acid transport [Acinetobacter sp.]MCR4530654.1 AzlD domain-containing protein [Acinetobacter venetianus]|tara:strand:- start:2759 stop:3085 length:327 start_codon:yes stop_codon:yes gene_type:complete
MKYDTVYIIAGITILSIGTYLIRYSGIYLANRIAFKEHHRQMLSDSACVLLFTLAVFNTIFTENEFSGISKIIGVSVAILFAWKRYSLIVVILVAIVVTATLRYLGFS